MTVESIMFKQLRWPWQSVQTLINKPDGMTIPECLVTGCWPAD